jgi:enterochelin esterase-like enzyme
MAAGAAAAAALALAAPAAAQGTLERIKVHSPSLEGNLTGDSPDRDVIVYLPPSYAAEPERRYPVIYNLHGYSIDEEFWARALTLPESVDRAIAAGAQEMIVVLPDGNNAYGGSMYSSSSTNGDWESFIAKDLVAYIDGHYRTIADRESRGLAGHSMGGYGTFRIGMKHPEVFSSLYPMSSCCLSPRGVSPSDASLESLTTLEEITATGFGGRTTFAVSAGWAPNPDKPPFYLDLPTENGAPREDVLALYRANAPQVMVAEHVDSLKQYEAIAMDVGLQDFLLEDNAGMDAALTAAGVAHSYETYEGDHVNKVGERFEMEVLPFFSEHLDSAE